MLKEVVSLLLFGFLNANVVPATTKTSDDQPEISHSEKPPHEFLRACYITYWGFYREDKGNFQIDNIKDKKKLCTHLIYVFANLNESLEEIVPADKNTDVDKGYYEQTTALKDDGLRVMLGIGGYDDSLRKYSDMIEDPIHRSNLASQITTYLAKYKFEGLMVAIGFPRVNQGKDESELVRQKENFVIFLKQLRDKFNEAFLSNKLFTKKPLLAVTVLGGEKTIETVYDLPRISELVDWVELLANNFHRYGESTVKLPAPFEVQPGDEEENSLLSIQNMTKLWLSKGVPVNKLVLQLAFYGNGFPLKNSSENEINSPAKLPPSDESTEADETDRLTAEEHKNFKADLSFFQIVDHVKNDKWTVVHKENLGSYAFSDSYWIGFDDKRDVALKAEYVRKNGFLGISVWTLDHECFQNDFPGGSYPLLTTVNDVLSGKIQLDEVKNLI